MTGAEFLEWLHGKKAIKECGIDFTLDPDDPGKIVLLSIQIRADNEELTIPYPRLDDSKETVFAKSVAVALVLNRLMEQYGLEERFSYSPTSKDGGIDDNRNTFGKIVHFLQKDGK